MQLYSLIDLKTMEIVKLDWLRLHEATLENASFARMMEPLRWVGMQLN